MMYLEKAQAFQRVMDEQGNFKAFERFYDENCTILEVPTGVERIGKDAQRDAMKEWFQSVEEFHDGGATMITSNEDEATTMIERWFDLAYKGGHRSKMKEIAVQKWKDDHIVEEKFYYNIPS